MHNSQNVAVLLTVYNRKNVTLHGLESLYASLAEMPVSYSFDIFMVDDGCIDGTSDAVSDRFPSVHIIKGTGSLYWGGGMNLAWKMASKHKDYDYYIWFNDDAQLYPHAIKMLFDIEKKGKKHALVCGVFEDKNHQVSYGGKTKDTQLIPLGSKEEVYYMNGNLVLIPQLLHKELGRIDNIFIHGGGDYDYGLRAKRKGFFIRLTESYVGIANRHDDDSHILYDDKLSLRERMKLLYSIKFSPITAFRLHRRYRGTAYAVYKFLRKNISVVLPFTRKINLFQQLRW